MFCVSAYADFNISARSDRNAINENETVKIILQSIGNTAPKDDPPAVAWLTQFNILSQSHGKDIRIINGKKEVRNQWVYTVQPLKSGTITVGALNWQGKTTIAFNVKVGNTPVSNNSQVPANVLAPAPSVPPPPPPPEFTLEAEIDKDNVPVQSQIIYTLRISRRVVLRGNINQPNFPNHSIVHNLGEKQYNKLINAHRYSIQEWRYAIFPQRSGVLNIPSASLDVYIGNSRRRQRATTKNFKIKVLASPANFAAGEWIAAKKLVLVEEWSTSPDDPLIVGKPITRKIIVRAEGVLAETLPSLWRAESNPSLKIYPEQPNLKNETRFKGVQGIRTETTVLIPALANTITLPAIALRWWDTEKGGIQTASLAGRELNIITDNSVANTNAIQLSESNDISRVTTNAGLSASSIDNQASIAMIHSFSKWWWLITGFAASGWGVLAFNYWQMRQRKLTQRGHAEQRLKQNYHNQQQLLKKATRYAKMNDFQSANTTLLKWAAQYWPLNPPNNLTEVARLSQSTMLEEAVAQFNRSQYREQDKKWDGTVLAEAIAGLLPKDLNINKKKHSSLPPLY